MPDQIDRIKEIMLKYILEHPSAADTTEGIAQWWVDGRIDHALHADVREAAEMLAREGVLKKKLVGSDVVYFVSDDLPRHAE